MPTRNREKRRPDTSYYIDMATSEFIAAIELSSSKITGVAGKKLNDGSMQILAYATDDASSFVRKGVIYNLDKTALSIKHIITELEDQLKRKISKVYTGISGQSLHTVKNLVTRSWGEEVIISEEYVDAICDENMEFALPNMEILDVVPQEYKIGSNLQIDPIGVASVNIMGNFLNLVARTSVKKKLESTFKQAQVEVADFFIAPITTANCILTDTERRLGCVLVDFGADTTTVSIYKNSILRYLAVLPLGGNNITRDITMLKVEEEEAEHLKTTLGNVMYEEEDDDNPQMYQLEDGGRSIEIGKLNNIIEARADEIVMNVCNQIGLSGYEDKLLGGLIITGGGANLKGIDTLLAKKSGIDKIRIARTTSQSIQDSLGVILNKGTQNTIIGLAMAGTENCCSAEVHASQKPTVAEPVQPMDMFKEDEDLKAQEAAALAAKKEKEEEQRKKEAAKKAASKPNKIKPWFTKTVEKFTKEIFTDDDLN